MAFMKRSLWVKISFIFLIGVVGLACPGLTHAAAQAFPFLQQVTRKAYPDAHAVLSREVESLRFKRDGSHVDVDEEFITILDEDGRRSEKVQSFFIDRSYSRLRIIEMEIIKPTGKRVKVNLKANSREETPPSDTEANIYDPNEKILKVFLPDLKIGDTIHYKVKRITFKPVIPGHLYGMILGQYTYPVKYYAFTITGPANVKLYTLIKDRVPGTVTRKAWVEGNLQVHRWVFQHVPQITPEPSMPSFVRVVMRLLYSTLPTWEAVSRWYYKLTEPKLNPTPAIVSKVRALTKGLSSDDAKLKALFYFVAQKIRYMGIIAEKNRPGFEPHAVGLTFSRRYGVCRDKAALLVSMLRVAGFRADMVLVNVGGKLDREIPVPYFNHAVGVVRDVTGMPLLYLDPTSETSKQFFPDYERDSSCLIADRRGDTLRITPSLPPDRNLFQLTIRDTFSENGALTGSLKAVCTGFVDTAFRYLMMVKGRQERKELLLRMFKRRYPGMEMTHVRWTNPADRRRPFAFAFDFRISRATVQGGRDEVFLLPLSDMENPGVLDTWILGKANMVRRKYPLRFGYTYKTLISEAIHFKTPPRAITLPAIRNVASSLLDYQTIFTLEGTSTLWIRREFALKKLEVTPGEYRQILAVQHDRRQRVTLPIILRSGL